MITDRVELRACGSAVLAKPWASLAMAFGSGKQKDPGWDGHFHHQDVKISRLEETCVHTLHVVV
ncbi:hypothetical protein [Verrucomicrobium sp. BvORR034]|jgi:hypothetical protein|uniref:hypothetical protein n=1 Tax=Verrucomicrobium sp. BvORR034 TaxID=1396418 RepID=UPI0022410021|nr:hypothetical protein [Verrucomicrobium sp. BvORR034]